MAVECGEEYQVVYWGIISSCQEGKGISWLWSVGKNIKRKKENGKQYYLPAGKNIKWGKREGDGNFRDVNQNCKEMGMGKNIKRNFIRPW